LVMRYTKPAQSSGNSVTGLFLYIHIVLVFKLKNVGDQIL
jgi:hypothetical protein